MYDRRILSQSSSDGSNDSISQTPTPTPYSPKAAPDTLADGNSLEAWKTLFKDRRAWAVELTDIALLMVKEVQRVDAETSVVRRSAAIAVENIKQHLAFLRPKFESSKTWADSTMQDQAYLISSWEAPLKKYPSIPAPEELGYCIFGAQAVLEGRKATGSLRLDSTLNDLVNVTEVRSAAVIAHDISRRFTDRLTDLNQTFESVVQGASDVMDNFSQTADLSDSDAVEQAARLMEEIEAIAKKLYADYEHILGLQNTLKSISQVSRTALLHTRNFLPSLSQTISEINQLLRQSTERKNLVMASALRYMQKIAAIESRIALVQSQLANLDMDKGEGQAFDTLNFVIRLPSVYGYLLIECVRRWEWTEKMTVDSTSLVEEVATFKEEEARRRKRWVKDMDGTVDLKSIDHMVLGVDINIQAQKQQWPNVTRKDVTQYTQALTHSGGFDETVKEVEALLRILDAPTRQQARRAKAFKIGSIHNAAFGSNSLLLRGDEEILRGMKSEKIKVEDKLKSSESRIRKLEDLLHRQSQVSRPTSGNAFAISNGTGLERQATSPTPAYVTSLTKPQGSLSRRSSVSSRRYSIQNDHEDKSLAQRITGLEAEIGSLNREAAANVKAESELKSQLQDVVSTNTDLLGNFEAQQREFDGERRSLEEENSKLKLKLEEMEDEVDRMLESRDHSDKIQSLEQELDLARNDSAARVQKAQGQIEFLHNDYTMQREKANQLERQLEQQGAENSELTIKNNELSVRLQSRGEAQIEHHRSLRAALLQLSKDESASKDFSALVELVESVAERSAAHTAELEDLVKALRADNVALDDRIRSRDQKIHDLKEKIGIEEMEVFTVRENLAEQRTRYSSLQAELDTERTEHRKLKIKYATLESTSGSLKAEIVDKDRMVADIAGRKSALEGTIQSLQTDLTDKQSRLEDLRKVYDKLSAHLGSRAARAEDISRRLYSQNKSLSRLLEQVGLTVTKQDDTMIISKTSRAVSASTVINETSMSMNRSLSGPLPFKTDFDTPADTEILRWARINDQDAEARQFEQYIRDVSSFDMTAFSEAIIKRVKEADHTARKWQREARAYRDKSHRAQSEAHEKIAFRSFREGDLALFLPTRNQATRPWAAFNVGAPHYFLREQDSHKLRTRDWLLARISKVEERVVDLSKSINGINLVSDGKSLGAASDGGTSLDDENPFELSDGLRWYLLDAAEEKPGAPINIGLSKVTVASANVDAKGSIRMKKSLDGNGATKTLTRSLDSRRSSTNSKKGLIATTSTPNINSGQGEAPETSVSQMDGASKDTQKSSTTQEAAAEPSTSQNAEEVRRNLLWGP